MCLFTFQRRQLPAFYKYQASVAFQNPQRALRNEACKTCLPDVLSAVKQKEQSEHINKAIVKPILKDFTIDSINTHNLKITVQCRCCVVKSL